MCSRIRCEAPNNEEGHQQHGTQDVNLSVNQHEANGVLSLDVSVTLPNPTNTTHRAAAGEEAEDLRVSQKTSGPIQLGKERRVSRSE